MHAEQSNTKNPQQLYTKINMDALWNFDWKRINGRLDMHLPSLEPLAPSIV